MSVAGEINDTLSPVVSKMGFRLWDIKVTKAGKRSIVSVIIDKHQGATLDEIAQVSKEIAPILDELESLEDSYHLEVSSPGLERSLTTKDHFVWSLGKPITVSYRSEGTVVRKNGKLVTVDDSNIEINNEDETTTIAFDSITKSHTLFDFEEAMKNGSKDQLQGDVAI